MTKSVRTEYVVDKHQVGENAVVYYEHGEKWDGTSRLIVCFPGHNGGAATYQQAAGWASTGLMALVRTGKYVAIATDAGGFGSWGNPASVTSGWNGVGYMRTRGCKPGKVGVYMYSMGTLAGCNFIKAHSADVAAALSWAGVYDGDFVNSTAGHTPVANNGTWTTEYTTAFGSYAASAGSRVWDEPSTFRGLGIKWKAIHATDDSAVPYSISQKFVADVGDKDMTLTTTTGGHVSLFSTIPDKDIVDHFDSANW